MKKIQKINGILTCVKLYFSDKATKSSVMSSWATESVYKYFTRVSSASVDTSKWIFTSSVEEELANICLNS